MLEDEAMNDPSELSPSKSSSAPEMIIADAIQILVRAGYAVQKISEQERE
jgi:hypothetical protein